MSQTEHSIAKGDYAYCSHSLLLTGDIIEIFVGRFVSKDETEDPTRVLQRFPRGYEIEGGSLMCILKLRRPMSLDDYRDIHRQSVRPIVQHLDDEVKMILLPAEMLCTIPDGM